MSSDLMMMLDCTEQDSIVAEWLRSLGLTQYSASFYDNGYDELELCKQIQDEDLDAIGVIHPLHRKIILDSVMILRSEGATSVYFTLEDKINRGRQSQNRSKATSVGGQAATRELIYDVSPRPQTRNNRDQSIAELEMGRLYDLINQKLEKEGVEVVSPPYALPSGGMSVPVVTALAMRYADELSQNYYNVMSVMERMYSERVRVAMSGSRSDLLQQQHNNATSGSINVINQFDGGESFYRQGQSPFSSGTTSSSASRARDQCDMFLGSINPPAVPSCPPPSLHSSGAVASQNGSPNLVQKSVQSGASAIAAGKKSQMTQPYTRSQSACTGLGLLQSRMYGQSSTEIPHLLRETSEPRLHHPAAHPALHSCGRSTSFQDTPLSHYQGGGYPSPAHHHPHMMLPPQYNCCPVPPQAALAHSKVCTQPFCKEVTVFEQKRLDALMQVKAGKLSVDEAMARIRLFEKQRNAICEKKNKQKKSATAKIGEFFKLPSFRRKNKSGKLSAPGNGNSGGGSGGDTTKHPATASVMPDGRCPDSCFDAVSVMSMAPTMSPNQLAEDLKLKCTCGLQTGSMGPQAMPAPIRPVPYNPMCSCDDCVRVRASVNPPPPPSPMLGHRSTSGGARASARFANKRMPFGADIVRAPPSCRQCNTPLNQPQKVLPKFYSPQITRKTYQPLQSPTPHHYNKPFSEKFDAWYQQNLPSDDETRHLIDPNMSDDSSMNLSFEAFAAGRIPVSHSSAPGSQQQQMRGSPAITARSSAAHLNSAFTSSMSKGGQSTVNNTSDLGNSYHSDSLSSDDCNTHKNIPSQQSSQQSSSQSSSKSSSQANQSSKKTGPTTTEVSPTTGGRVRRDSGCYLSNENINNNSSNSSTCEKKSDSSTLTALPVNTAQTSEPGTQSNNLSDRLRSQMGRESIDLTIMPYTDEDGQWCVPISLVSRYAQLCTTDLTTVALAMDSIRCNDLSSHGRPSVPLSADTKRSPEQKRVSNIHDFMVLSGLPMYTELLASHGVQSLSSLSNMNENSLRDCGITDPLHLEIIVSAIKSTWSGGVEVPQQDMNAQQDFFHNTTAVHHV